MSISDRLLVSALFSSNISVICISAKNHIGATLVSLLCQFKNMVIFFVQSALLFLQLLFHTCDQETAYVTIGGELLQYC